MDAMGFSLLPSFSTLRVASEALRLVMIDANSYRLQQAMKKAWWALGLDSTIRWAQEIQCFSWSDMGAPINGPKINGFHWGITGVITV